MADHVLAIDQGTTSTRAIVFDARGDIVAVAQREHEQIFPRAGWVEHDPDRDLDQHRVGRSQPPWIEAPARAGAISPAWAITNQRETAIVWDRRTGRPGPQRDRLAGHAHAAADRRLAADGGADRFAELDRAAAGHLLLGIQDRVDPRERPGARVPTPRRGDLLFGTPDTWLVWNLTGGHPRRHPRHRCHERQSHPPDGPRDARRGPTSCSRCSASRARCCPRSARPRASWARCTSRRAARGIPIAGILGDQQAATFGQAAFESRGVEEHLRHRQLPAGQHRHRDRALAARPHHDRRISLRGASRRTTRSRARSR